MTNAIWRLADAKNRRSLYPGFPSLAGNAPMCTASQFPRSLLICLAIPVGAYAHVDEITGQDYQGFERNDGMGSCCDWHDCRPAFEPFMEKDGEKIIDRGNNKFSFDPGKVVKRPSDDGNWHVCGNATKLQCIIAPAQVMRDPDPAGSLFGGFIPSWPVNQTRFPIATAPICKALW